MKEKTVKTDTDLTFSNSEALLQQEQLGIWIKESIQSFAILSSPLLF